MHRLTEKNFTVNNKNKDKIMSKVTSTNFKFGGKNRKTPTETSYIGFKSSDRE